MQSELPTVYIMVVEPSIFGSVQQGVMQRFFCANSADSRPYWRLHLGVSKVRFYQFYLFEKINYKYTVRNVNNFNATCLRPQSLLEHQGYFICAFNYTSGFFKNRLVLIIGENKCSWELVRPYMQLGKLFVNLIENTPFTSKPLLIQSL